MESFDNGSNGTTLIDNPRDMLFHIMPDLKNVNCQKKFISDLKLVEKGILK